MIYLWIKWLAAFMIVLSILTIGIALQEWREWRKNPHRTDSGSK